MHVEPFSVGQRTERKRVQNTVRTAASQSTTNWTGTWDGGMTMLTRGGITRWVLLRQVAGSRVSITLKVSSQQDALAELALYNRDPVAYIKQARLAKATRGADLSGGVFLNQETVNALVASQEAGRISPKHIADLRRYLKTWLEELGSSRDLRLVPKAPLEAILDRKCKPAQKAKRRKLMVALATYCNHLHRKGLLDPSQSPARWFEYEKAEPAKVTRRRDHSAPVLERCYAHIQALPRSGQGGPTPKGDQSQAVRDTMLLMVRHGLHHTEVMRLAEGHGEIRVIDDHPHIKGVLGFFHQKKRGWHYISVDAQVLAAVLRLRARRRAPNDTTIRRYLNYACKVGNVREKVLPSKFRHSFVTLGKTGGRKVKVNEAGLSLEDLGSAAGHRNTRTTEENYDGTRIEDLIVIPVKFQHPDDL